MNQLKKPGTKHSDHSDEDSLCESTSDTITTVSPRERGPNIVFQGHLNYRAKLSLFSNWKRHYLVLHKNGKLQLFRHSTDYKPKEEVIITNGTQIVDGVDITGKKLSFCVFVKGKNPIYLLASTEAEKNKWMNQLHSVTGSSSDKVHIMDALEGIVDAAVVTDEKGIIVGINSKACEVLGYTKKEAIGADIKITMPPAIAAMHDSYMIRYAKTGEKRLIGVPRKLIMKHKDGSDLLVEVSLGEVPKHQQDGQCKFIAIFRSLAPQTEKVHAMKDLVYAADYTKKELKGKLNDLMKDFVSQFSKAMDVNYGLLLEEVKRAQQQIAVLKAENERISAELQETKKENQLLQEEINMLKQTELFSVAQILRSPIGYEPFLKFCMKENCEEVCQFWKDAEEYRTMRNSDPEELKKQAKAIYDKYFTEGSDYELNISHEVKSVILRHLENPTRNMFVSVQADMLLLLKENAFKRFCLSDIGKGVIASLSIELNK